ncbi:MAG: hypothetical protein OEV41_05350 [Gammaproteobacteria bacterium]|nr:hypothetical protein [Gammaproteobacteria bacterium]MDH5345577.1 hypothetical protein [Gammaproteobacteria bacterium]
MFWRIVPVIHPKRVPCALLVLALAACQAGNPLLNSERIERKFGSYGVEVLATAGNRRVTSLYSGSGNEKTMRTYAVVEFPGPARPEYRKEHDAIVGGESIGSTFERAGWEIRKQSTFMGELDVPASYELIGQLMGIDLPATLAVHEYLFIIERDERSFHYAKIVELHHPAYLDAAELEALYGVIVLDDSNRDRIHDFIGPPAGNEWQVPVSPMGLGVELKNRFE